MKKLTEYTENKLNISQIWLRGFELATYYHCHRSSKSFNRHMFEKCAKIVRIAKLMKTYFFTVDCVSNHINEYTEERILILSSFLRNYCSKKVKSVCILIVIHSIVTFDATQKM